MHYRTSGVVAALFALAAAVPARAQVHFDSCSAGTGSNATVLIDPAIGPSLDGNALASGDELAVFTPAGLCAGTATWSGQVVAVTVWGDDPFTTEVDGMVGGEALAFRVWDASSSTEWGTSGSTVDVQLDSTPPYRGDATFLPDAIYNVTSLTGIPANRSPIAAFDASTLAGPAPLSVDFDAAASDDPDGNIVSYAWDFGTGQGASGSLASHTFETPGTYDVVLTVVDNEGAAGTASRQITVGSVQRPPPIASFIASPDNGPAPLIVSVDASASSDPVGIITTYAWDFGDGATAAGATAAHTYNSPGSYVITLRVTNDVGGWSTATLPVTVNEPVNEAPRASFSVTPTSGIVPVSVNVDANGSSDLDGSIVSYEWDFGDGATAQGVTASHTYSTVGTYTITLVVTDNDESAGSTTRTVTVSSPSNQPPTAAFTATPQSGSAPLLVSTDAQSSSDADGTISNYAWSFGDGATGSGATAQHEYVIPGTYTLMLTVTDDDGASTSVSRQIQVAAPANVSPQASFTLTPSSGNAPLPVSVDASGSSDSDGSIVSYAWEFGDGHTALGINATHTYEAVGSYTVRLTVTDDDGASVSATRPVSVTSPSNAAPSAAFTVSTSNGVAPLTVDFDASGSTDSDGSVAAYAWTFGDGGSATGVTASRTYTTPGAFEVLLQVTDDDGAVATATRTINVAAPPAEGGLVLHYTFDEPSGNTVNDASGLGYHGTLQGAATRSDNGVFGRALRLDGSNAGVSVPDSPDLNDLILRRRTISLWFRVDNRFESGRKQVVFEAGGPTRGLNIYLYDGLLYVGGWNTRVEESGWSGSFIATGGVRSGAWHHVALVLNGNSGISARTLRGFLDGVEFGAREGSQIWPHIDDTGIGRVAESTLFHDGEPQSGQNNSLAGYVDDVRLYNEALNAAQVAAIFEESGELQNQPPVARLVISPPGGQAPASLTFDATTSSDPDNNIQVYRWSFGDGGSATGSVVTHTYSKPGTFTVSLAVEDSEGASSSATQTVVITAPSASNQSPAARFTVSEAPDDPFTRVFDATGSTDGDGLIDQYVWDFGDGTAGIESTMSHTFPGAGTYIVKLTVVDNEGATDVQQSTVQIVQPLPLSLEVNTVGPVAVSGTVLFEDDRWVIEAPGGASQDPRTDAFEYVHRVVSGDEQMTVRVDSIENTDRWAFAGVMFRAGLEQDAPHVAMTLTPESGPVFAYRLVDGGWEVKSQSVMMSAPLWLRIVRTENVFEGQYSSDGLSWTTVGSQAVNMGQTIRGGIVAASNNNEQQATAVLADLSFGEGNPVVDPTSFELSEVYPNPTAATADLSLRLVTEQHVFIAAYNVLGERVAILHDGMLEADTQHDFVFDGRQRASGLYLIQVYGEQFRQVRKITLVR